MTKTEVLDYETRSSWWAGFIWFSWGQRLVATYFVWKTKRKWNRWFNSRFNKAYIELLKEVSNDT